ncbi:spore maturation protein CgeB [Cohnella sp. OV330]|uniref:CgeB family protein n=1 Tax=Cohnella sp. OV330 TaxID=1855288 RepID=UPI0008E98D4C|nr:glycosyltransferase [Cohnella sp. OV330]SFA93577.1 spore maturation protein CgeB [Cohnella sp. OV330]
MAKIVGVSRNKAVAAPKKRRRNRAAAGVDGFGLGWQHGYWHGQCESIVQRTIVPSYIRDLHVLFITSGKGFPYSPLDEAVGQTLMQLVSRLSVMSPKDDIVGFASREMPALAIVLDGLDFPVSTIDALRSLGIRTAIWFTDDPYYTEVTADLAPHYDFVFTLERNCVPFYEQRGCARVHYLPLGVHTADFRPRNPRHEIRGDICFIGSAYWNRIRLFEELLPRMAKRRFRLSGLWWDRLSDFQRWRDRIDLGKWMGPLETAEQYNAHKIVINVHRAHDDSTFNRNLYNIPAVSPNPRTFEIAACGTLLMSDNREDLAQFYTPGVEIVTYDSAQDMAEKMDYYLAHEDERRQIALNGLYRTLRDHTYVSRLSQLLDLATIPLA